ncbi:MAG TPA: tetratricopeptide repeat protein [Candidatus Binataceae bacterium]|nr:tetratricopeptide repeat protein [Candidatus Binataceae bacterium]
MPANDNTAAKTSAREAGFRSEISWFNGESAPRVWLGALLIVAGLIYSRCLSHEFVLDDYDWANNRYIGDWSFIWKSFVSDAWWYLDPAHPPQSSYYRPMLDVWAALNFHLFGVNPFEWHLAMVAISLLVVWQAFRIANLLTGNAWTALLCAALFALMPGHAESIVWPSAICQPLYAAFVLGSFEFHLRLRDVPVGDPRHLRWLVISMALFAGALLTYEPAALFPLLIVLHGYLFPNEASKGAPAQPASELWKIIFDAVFPYVVLTIAYLLLRFWVLGFISRPYLVKHVTGLESILTMPYALAIYLMIMAIPTMAGPAHRLDAVESLAAPGFYLPLLGLIILFGTGFFLLRSHPHRRLYVFCMAWILIAFAPMLNLQGLFAESLIQDRYLYFPSFGLCLMAADLAVGFGDNSPARSQAIWTASAVALAISALLLFSVERFWHDDIALYEQCIVATPDVGIWHYRLGRALAARGNLKEARQQLERTVALEPNAGGNILFDLGLIEEKLGDRTAAEREMSEGLKRFANPPLVAYRDVAIAADAAGDYKGAEAVLKQAEAQDGGVEMAAMTRAQILSIHGNRAGAEAALRELLRRNPDNAQALAALGTTLSSDGHLDDALDAYRHASLLEPHDSNLHYRIALTLHKLGRNREAHDECALALSSMPSDPNVRALMAELEHAGAPD